MDISRTEKVTDNLDSIVWTIVEGGQIIAELTAHTSGLILNVEVDADHRGQGLARVLFEHADRTHGLLHVPSWGRTEDGEAFAEAMGGDVMDDQQACDILGLDVDVVTGAAFAA